MTATNLYGPSVSLPTLERMLTTHAKSWLPAYIAEAERSEQIGPDGVTAHVVGTLPMFRSYRPTQGRVDKWPEDQLPALLFGSPGLSEPAARDGRGRYRASWSFGYTIVASGNDDRSTRWLAGVYAVAVRKLFVQQPRISGLDVEGLAYDDESYDVLPFARGRSLMAATVAFTLTLATPMADARGGPAAVPASPTADPGPLPTVITTELTTTRRA